MSEVRVLVTRAREDAAELCASLEARGAVPVPLPLLAFEEAEGGRCLGARIAELKPAWVVITSAHAVFALRAAGPLPEGVRLAAVGAKTGRRLELSGFRVDHVGREGAAELARNLEVKESGALVLHVAGDRALPVLARDLEARGARTELIVVYRTVPAVVLPALRDAALKDLSAACFTSPSTVRGLVDVAGEAWISAVRVSLLAAAIGRTTAAALREAGFRRVVNAREPTPESLAAAVAEELRLR